MSWIKCSNCGQAINSDNDPDCFVYVGNYKRLHSETVLCEPCRDERRITLEQQDHERSRAESVAEKVDAETRKHWP